MSGGRVLVTGATGTVGRELVPQLVAAGASIVALTRNPDADFPAQVEGVVGDLGERSTLTAALHDVLAVFLLTGGPEGPGQDANLVAAARKAGVQHIVKLSALSVEKPADDPITLWHLAGEKAVRDSGIAWTFLRPTGFMSNTLSWAGTISTQGMVFAPYGTGRTSLIDPADIAAVAVATLTQPGHEGRAYPLTGPQGLTPAEQVEILAGVLGKPLRYVEVAPETVRENLTGYGMTVEQADAVVLSLAQALTPEAGAVHPTVEQIVGRPATSLHDWAERHAEDFLAGASGWS